MKTKTLVKASEFRVALAADKTLLARFKRMWKREDGPAGRCGAKWWFGTTNAHVQHCGHPTAFRPYYFVDSSGASWYAGDGKGFYYLQDAQIACMLAELAL